MNNIKKTIPFGFAHSGYDCSQCRSGNEKLEENDSLRWNSSGGNTRR